jgi:hypothetical protein
VAEEKKKYWFVLVLLFFIIYVFIAAQPVPVETVLTSRWLISVESNFADVPNANPEGAQGAALFPFRLGNRFGYVDAGGRFAVNQEKKGEVALSGDNWAEYEAVPETIEVRDPRNNTVLTIRGARGYPMFLDKRILLVNSEQNALSAVDEAGEIRWTYDFAAPLTCVDAAAGLILAGSLDGIVELLDDQGQMVFFFVPGGSRRAVIQGCRISSDGSKLAIISGIDDQRFLLLERFGDTYKVVYHEFLEDGFRRAVHLAFIDHDTRVVFEREGGLGIFEIGARTSVKLPLEGEIAAIDESGTGGLIFIITSGPDRQKNLLAVGFPGTVLIDTPFKSETIFLGRHDSRLYIGGGMTLASFELDRR